MADTYSQIYIHIIFSVSARQSLIPSNKREELQKYITGIIAKRNQKLMAIYCMPDHTHLLLSMSPNLSISEIVRDIKAGSSKFLTDNKIVKGKFSWQAGFGAFSYSQSQLPKVINYILSQKDHHKTTSFKDEYITLLEKFQVEYKTEYLFDWIEE